MAGPNDGRRQPRGPHPRGGGRGHPDRVHDVVTPTEREAREADVARRRRRYFAVMIPCMVLVLFGFLVPAPLPLRLGALAVAALMPPAAALWANAGFGP